MTGYRSFLATLCIAGLSGLLLAQSTQAQTPGPARTPTVFPRALGTATAQPGMAAPLSPVATASAGNAVMQAMAPPMTATLVGDAEVPGPGDGNGVGSAAITVDTVLRTACYALHVVGISTPTGAHIHEADVGVSGPVVIPLNTPTNGDSSGCAQNVDVGVLERLRDNPARFYVNVHNADFPEGAVRGQLGR